ncbi:hypothetical protein F2P81_000909 [Scophthalmus maximus]|uniref:Uncharacterized protein n=1 Tax=Scophthalmus maximus TaxID=52904 RepID=A0A6A4TIA1_SCOMX|nr:hypothetical protein F2P81_000909 [Scophthalmus maximus]
MHLTDLPHSYLSALKRCLLIPVVLRVCNFAISRVILALDLTGVLKTSNGECALTCWMIAAECFVHRLPNPNHSPINDTKHAMEKSDQLIVPSSLSMMFRYAISDISMVKMVKASIVKKKLNRCTPESWSSERAVQRLRPQPGSFESHEHGVISLPLDIHAGLPAMR